MPEGLAKPQSKEPEIRTMRDDLAQAKQVVKPAAPTPPLFRAPIPPPKGSGAVLKTTSFNAPSAPFSLAPQLPEKSELLTETKGKGDKVLTVLIILFVVSALSAAGVWAWIFFGGSNGTEENSGLSEDNTPKTFAEIIPSNSLLVAHYTITTPEEREALLQAWKTSQAVTQPATMVETIGGNPALLLEEATVSEFAYVLLPGDPRLYLVVEGSQEIDQILAQYSNIQVLEVANWRIVHSFATDVYEQQLVNGSRSAAGKTTNGVAAASLTLHVSRPLLEEIHSQSAVVLGGADELTLGMTFKEEGGKRVAYFQNTQSAPLPADVPIDTAGLLAAIPSDAAFIRIGTSFTDQSFRFSNPASLQRLEEFSGPYAYFERTGDDGAKDTGVVTVVPAEVNASLTLPDVAIETALPLLHEVSALGGAPSAELAFVDGVYKEIPLRYVNINTPALALDYAFLGNLVALASSKEGMYTLIDVARGQAASVAAGPWAALDQKLSGYGGQKVFGSLTQPAIKRLLPGGEAVSSLPFAFAFTNEAGKSVVAGAVVLEESNF